MGVQALGGKLLNASAWRGRSGPGTGGKAVTSQASACGRGPGGASTPLPKSTSPNRTFGGSLRRMSAALRRATSKRFSPDCSISAVSVPSVGPSGLPPRSRNSSGNVKLTGRRMLREVSKIITTFGSVGWAGGSTQAAGTAPPNGGGGGGGGDPAPWPLPGPAPLPAPAPTPWPAPWPVPSPCPVPAPAPLPAPCPVPSPWPAPAPLPAPTPGVWPVPLPCPAPPSVRGWSGTPAPLPPLGPATSTPPAPVWGDGDGRAPPVAFGRTPPPGSPGRGEGVQPAARSAKRCRMSAISCRRAFSSAFDSARRAPPCPPSAVVWAPDATSPTTRAVSAVKVMRPGNTPQGAGATLFSDPAGAGAVF